MIIGIDGYEANVKNRVGIGQYAFEIIRSLYNLVKNNPELKKRLIFRVYIPDNISSDMPEAGDFWTYRRTKPKKLWTFIGLPLILLQDKPKTNVFFSPTHYTPRFINIPKVCSVMDLSYLKYPHMFKRKDLIQLTQGTRYSVKSSRAIITISQNSKHAIMASYNVPDKRVSITYPGLRIFKNQIMTTVDIYKKYQISKNFILSVGTIQPRKNYQFLINAFAQYLKSYKKDIDQMMLVIIGKKGWQFNDILSEAGNLGISGQVKFLDYVPDNELAVFYKNAMCLVMPSLYEGFGLPVLEAMSLGCPVVVSRVSSLPEIAGDAGIYIDPNDLKSLVTGIKDGITSRNTPEGKVKIKIGLERAKQFTWEKAAQKTLEILEKVGREASSNKQ